MTPERLAEIRAHILNPPSASLNREWMLELVAEVERAMTREPVVVDVSKLPVINVADLPPGAVIIETTPGQSVSAVDLGGRPGVVIDDRKKKGAKK